MYVWIEGLSYFHTRSGYSSGDIASFKGGRDSSKGGIASSKGGIIMKKSAERRSGSERRKVVDPRYLGVKSKRKRGKEPRRKEDRVDKSKGAGPLGF